MDGKPIINSPKGKSLTYEINRWLILLTLGISLIASIISGVWAFFEAREIQDKVLIQFAFLVKNDTLYTNISKLHYSDDAQIIIQPLSASYPLNLKQNMADGLHTINQRHNSWRVLIESKQVAGIQQKIVVAQSTELRDEIAMSAVANAIIPIMTLTVLLFFIIYWVISRQMKPVITLSQSLNKDFDNRLPTLPVDNIPTEIRPFLNAINRLLTRTQELMTKQKRFIADAAHELRTPIAALSLLSENLSNSANEQEYQTRSQRLQTGLVRLNSLVAQLLDLARLQNTDKQEFTKVNFTAIVEDTIVTLYPLSQAKNIDLGVINKPTVWLLDQDHGLAQIAKNAISNAILYSPENSVINIDITQSAEEVCFMVTDQGPGINDNEIEKVFEPFYRSNSNFTEGNGLGLAICTQIANHLGGRILLKNGVKEGLVFTYTQPL